MSPEASHPWPGDDVGRFRLQRLVAYRGKEGCTDPWCTTTGDPDRCYGWHCSLCDARTNMMGHHDCPRAQDVGE